MTAFDQDFIVFYLLKSFMTASKLTLLKAFESNIGIQIEFLLDLTVASEWGTTR